MSFGNTTENKHSVVGYCLTSTPYCSLEANLVTLFCCFFKMMRSYLGTQQSHAQFVREVQTVPFLVSQMKYRGKSRFGQICCCKGHYNRQGFCT